MKAPYIIPDYEIRKIFVEKNTLRIKKSLEKIVFPEESQIWAYHLFEALESKKPWDLLTIIDSSQSIDSRGEIFPIEQAEIFLSNKTRIDIFNIIINRYFLRRELNNEDDNYFMGNSDIFQRVVNNNISFFNKFLTPELKSYFVNGALWEGMGITWEENHEYLLQTSSNLFSVDYAIFEGLQIIKDYITSNHLGKTSELEYNPFSGFKPDAYYDGEWGPRLQLNFRSIGGFLSRVEERKSELRLDLRAIFDKVYLTFQENMYRITNLYCEDERFREEVEEIEVKDNVVPINFRKDRPTKPL